MYFSYSCLYLTFEHTFKVIITILNLWSVHSNICVSSGSIAIDWFYSLHYGTYFSASLHAGNFGMDSRRYKFYLVGCRILSYSYTYLEVCSEAQLNQLERVWSFGFLLLRLVNWGPKVLILGLIISYCKGKTLLCTREHTKINNKKQSNFKKRKTFEQILLQNFFKIWMANRQIKIHTRPLVIREVQIKTMMRCNYKSIRMTKIFKN